MTVKVLIGLPGSGKSATLITEVDKKKRSGDRAFTVMCSDAPQLQASEGLTKHGRIGSRNPKVSTELNHFVPFGRACDLLKAAQPGELWAFDEAQYYPAAIVDHWLAADARGVSVLVSCPSTKQLGSLRQKGATVTELTMLCQLLLNGPAEIFYKMPGADLTLSVSRQTSDILRGAAVAEIVKRLRDQEPHRGKEIIYQPVDLPEVEDWRPLRPDTEARFHLLSRLADEVFGKNHAERPTKTYIDVGCNTGYFVHHMRRIGFNATGMDVVPGDIEVAKLLDTYVYRDHNKYICQDAIAFFSERPGQRYDFASSFSTFQWVIIQSGGARGLEAMRQFLEASNRVCVLELGYISEEHYRNKLPVPIDREWTREFMAANGDFKEIRLIKSGEQGLSRDIFIGLR